MTPGLLTHIRPDSQLRDHAQVLHRTIDMGERGIITVTCRGCEIVFKRQRWERRQARCQSWDSISLLPIV